MDPKTCASREIAELVGSIIHFWLHYRMKAYIHPFFNLSLMIAFFVDFLNHLVDLFGILVGFLRTGRVLVCNYKFITSIS